MYRARVIVAAAGLILFPAFVLAASPCPYVWNQTLRQGARGDDVRAMQQLLNVEPQSGYFGPMTATAVRAFQTAHGLEPVGIAGPLTRAAFGTVCAAPTVSDAATSGDTDTRDVLTVSDPGQPASTIAPHDSSPDFFDVTLTAGAKDVTVSEVDFDRVGLGSDAAFYYFGLYDEDGLQIGPTATPNSQHRIAFRKPFVIPAHTEKTFQVYGSMQTDLTDFDGQMPALRLVNIMASSPVEGAIPLQGTAFTLNNSLTIGSATLTVSPLDPSNDTNRNIGDTNVRFSGVRITAASQEDLTLTSIIWTQSGTAGPSDLANVVTNADGTSYSTSRSPYANNEYVTMFDPGIRIPKGQSVDVYVQGDLLPSAANRTVRFDIRDNSDDIALEGERYGFAVSASPAGNTATDGSSVFLTSDGTTDGDSLTPFYQGSTATVYGASVTYFGK